MDDSRIGRTAGRRNPTRNAFALVGLVTIIQVILVLVFGATSSVAASWKNANFALPSRGVALSTKIVAPYFYNASAKQPFEVRPTETISIWGDGSHQLGKFHWMTWGPKEARAGAIDSGARSNLFGTKRSTFKPSSRG